jgi:hypothetical protein
VMVCLMDGVCIVFCVDWVVVDWARRDPAENW